MCFSPNLFVCPDGLFARHLGNYAQQKSRTSLFTARSELREVMFLALSVTFLLYEISREPQPLNGFAPNSQGRRVWSLARTSLKVKIVTGKEKIISSQFFAPYASNYNTRCHCRKLTTRRHLDLRKNVFSQRVVHHWNELPDSVVTASTVNTFKNRLDREWGNKSSH